MYKIRPRMAAALIAALLALQVTYPVAASAEDRMTMKDKYFMLTYPATVKLPQGNCGKFIVKYAMSPLVTKAGVGEIELKVWTVDMETGDYLDVHSNKTIWYKVSRSLNSPLKGSIAMDFCKTDWKLKAEKSRADAYSTCSARCHAVLPGTYKLTYEVSFVKGENFETLVRTESNNEGDITFVE